MSIDTQGRFFGRKENLKQMFSLRIAGWSYSAIARYYQKDHTTILYHCQKWGVHPNGKMPKVLLIEIARRKPSPKVGKYDHYLDEIINLGKPSYRAYLREAEKVRDGF